MKIGNWKLKIIISALLLGSAAFYILNNQLEDKAPIPSPADFAEIPKEDIITAPKPADLIEQNLDEEDENFSVLSTKLDTDKGTYQLAFELQNNSDQNKNFYLIPVSNPDQTQFQSIKEGDTKGGTATWDYEAGWDFDTDKHKQELIPALAQAYDDIDEGGYTGQPIKLTLTPQTTLTAQAQWGLPPEALAKGGLNPVYFLIHGSAGGAKEELTILNVRSHPQAGDNWTVSFETKGVADLTITPTDQATIDDDEFVSLSCDDEERTPQILANDVIFYPDWECPPTGEAGSGQGKVVHYTKKAGKHTLQFQFGGVTDFAYNATTAFKIGLGAATPSDTTSWYRESGWKYRKKITIDNTNVDSDLTDFPLYVFVEGTGSGSSLGSKIQDSGEDLRFTASDGITDLPHEIESYSESGGNSTAYIWTKVPTVSNSATTDIYMYYGNSDASDGQNATGVWDDNYIGVWHLEETVEDEGTDTTGPHKDSTSVASHGDQYGNDDTTTAKVYKAQYFDGTDDYVDAGSKSSLDNIPVKTISAWAKRDETGVAHIISLKGGFWEFTVSADKIAYWHNWTSGGWGGGLWRGDTTINADTWYHFAVTYDNSSSANDPSLYVNAIPQTETEASPGHSGSSSDDNAADVFISATGDMFKGQIDELRISNIARSANWIKFEHANINESDNELSWGSEGEPSITKTKGGIWAK